MRTSGDEGSDHDLSLDKDLGVSKATAAMSEVELIQTLQNMRQYLGDRGTEMRKMKLPERECAAAWGRTPAAALPRLPRRPGPGTELRASGPLPGPTPALGCAGPGLPQDPRQRMPRTATRFCPALEYHLERSGPGSGPSVDRVQKSPPMS